MIRQRGAGTAPAIQAAAEAMPFRDDSRAAHPASLDGLAPRPRRDEKGGGSSSGFHVPMAARARRSGPPQAAKISTTCSTCLNKVRNLDYPSSPREIIN